MTTNLCETCSNYRLTKLFTAHKVDASPRWDAYQLRQQCLFCCLLGWMLARTDLSSIVCSTITCQARELEGGQKALFFLFESSNKNIAPVKCPYVLLPLASGYNARYEVGGGFTHLARAAQPQSFDADLIKDWIRQCDGKHGIDCSMGSRTQPSTTELRLVDIDKQCVVNARSSARYAALSYVWGDVKPPVLRRENEYLLRMNGALKALPLPQTIVDAMAVTRKLGIRYLWVDSLCIQQDDELDVQEQVEHMDIIYKRAYLTIIVTTGDNCRAAIPSVSQPRAPIQETITIDGMAIGTVHLRVRDDILKTKWASRGWTLQEYALSYRSLIFTNKGTFFSCSEGIRREDMTGYWTNCLPRPQRYMFPIVLDCAIANKVDTEVLRKVYAPLVSNFTNRDLTFVEDTLHAFMGITQALTPSLKRFEWCVPARAAEHVQYTLCWSRPGQLSRVEGFPSWSWVGWTASKSLDASSSPSSHTGVRFLTDKQADAIIRMGDVYRPYRTDVSTALYKGEKTQRVDFAGRSNEMIHLKTWLAPINPSTHQAFVEWLSSHWETRTGKPTIYEFLGSKQVEDPRTWFEEATLCLLLADAAEFLVALPVEKDPEDEVYQRIGNPIFMPPKVWEAYKPKSQELFLA